VRACVRAYYSNMKLFYMQTCMNLKIKPAYTLRKCHLKWLDK